MNYFYRKTSDELLTYLQTFSIVLNPSLIQNILKRYESVKNSGTRELRYLLPSFTKAE